MLRVPRAVPKPTRGPSCVAVAQEALACDLLQVAEAHEDWIQQYIRMYGVAGDGV